MEAIAKVIQAEFGRISQTSSQQSDQPRQWCAKCNYTGWIVCTERRAQRPCECRERKIMESRLSAIPPEFRRCDLGTLEPRTDLHPKQASALRAIQANPRGSFLLAGRNGVGKTLLAWSLYREAAIYADRSVHAFGLADLFDEYRRAETAVGQDWQPRLVPSALRKREGSHFVFLDEFEKARRSEFASEMLFRLVDAAYAFRQQLVITTNLTLPALADHWSAIDPVYGDSIARRLRDMCTYVELF